MKRKKIAMVALVVAAAVTAGAMDGRVQATEPDATQVTTTQVVVPPIELEVLDGTPSRDTGGGGSTALVTDTLSVKGPRWTKEARTQAEGFLQRLRWYWKEFPEAAFRVDPGIVPNRSATTPLRFTILEEGNGDLQTLMRFVYPRDAEPQDAGAKKSSPLVSAFKAALRTLAKKEAAGVDNVEQELDRVDKALGGLDSAGAMEAYKVTQRADELSQPNPELTKRKAELELSLTEKKARRMALERAVAEETQKQAERKKEDPIAEGLRDLIQIREKALDLVNQQAKAATASADQVFAAQAAVTEAKLKLLEREEAVSKTGKGELIDRLSSELRMTTVDQTQMEIELQITEVTLNRDASAAKAAVAKAQETWAKYEKDGELLVRRKVLLLLSQSDDW